MSESCLGILAKPEMVDKGLYLSENYTIGLPDIAIVGIFEAGEEN